MIIMGLTEVSHEVTLLRKVDHAILLLPTVHKTQFDPVTFAVVYVYYIVATTQSGGQFHQKFRLKTINLYLIHSICLPMFPI